MSAENKTIIRRLLEDIWNNGNLAIAPEIVANNYVSHDPVNPAQGLSGLKEEVNLYRTAFPDLRFTIEDMLSEGDKVVARWTARGTHKSDLMGIRPTGKQATTPGITIVRISNRKIVEEWAQWDALGLMRQLGVVPAFGQAKGKTA